MKREMSWKWFIQELIGGIFEAGFILIFLYLLAKFILALIRLGKGC